MKKKIFDNDDVSKLVFLKGPKHYVSSLDYIGQKLFRDFYKNFPQYRGKLKEKDTTTILKTFASNFREAVVNNRDGAELPERLGRVHMKSYPYNEKYRFINRAESIKLGKVIRKLNLHTDGTNLVIACDVKGDKYNWGFKHIWDFGAFYLLRREGSKIYSDNWQNYVCAEKEWKGKKIISDYYSKKFTMRNEEEHLKNYNEFYID